MNIFNITYLVWILSEILLNRFTRSGKSDRQNADKKTLLFIWLSIIASIAIAIWVAMIFSFPVFADEKLRVIGIGIIAAGILIRFIAIKQLGRFFTVDVTIRKDHELMQRGFYKYVRHPSYSGSLLSMIGFGLSLNNWLAMIVVFVPVLFTFMLRIRLEEQVLTEQFGSRYTDYAGKTKRLIPFVY